MNPIDLKKQLLQKDPAFWPHLKTLTEGTTDFGDLIQLSNLRKKALAAGMLQSGPKNPPLRLALLGGCSLYPLHELLTHLLAVSGLDCELFLGGYDNYNAEIMDAGSALYEFRPQAILLLPGTQRCHYSGKLTDARGAVQDAAGTLAAQLLGLCHRAHEHTKAEILLGNFPLAGRHDPGAARARIPTSDWNFRKWVNLELGLNAPPFLHICDIEFLVNRLGALQTEDARGWFESKQPGTPLLLVALAHELARIILALRTPPKKVLVLDLDNTLWGGVVAEDGVEGIELGDTSPRGEAFKAFQRHVAALKARGILLAVCSKNDLDLAREPFTHHPEMILRAEDFVSFKANWQPKPDNLRQMAAELNLTLDSFVFADDNPAEIELVRQATPEVATLLLGPDPADYVAQLQDCRLFEPQTLTDEDTQRTHQYLAEAGRRETLAAAADMPAYLESLAMTATLSDFTPLDAPRLAQLINKSNQFNLTTRRRTEAEVLALIGRKDAVAFSVRLQDMFGDHGLIAIATGLIKDEALEIDTWLMSCRVLQRQVEDEVLNELARLTQENGCKILRGHYLPTPKNGMVREFYPNMGFKLVQESATERTFELPVPDFKPHATKIKVTRATRS